MEGSPISSATRRPAGRSVALGPREARLAAWAHVLPPFGSLVVRAATREPSPALQEVLRQANRLGGGILALLLALSLLSYVARGVSEVLLGIVGFLVLLLLLTWVGGGAWLAMQALRGRVPIVSRGPGARRR